MSPYFEDALVALSSDTARHHARFSDKAIDEASSTSIGHFEQIQNDFFDVAHA
ncbi:MAG TPA: hypothetical protein VG963_18070 [Polyangiaceae bacterium]|nr:hypothetical protein [Polyangiaceae bacterium]